MNSTPDIAGIDPSLIAEIVNISVDLESVQRVFLFGSRVKGTARYDSDLDVAIEIREDHPGSMLAAYMLDVADDGRWQELERRFGIRIGLAPIEDVTAAVEEHGRLIFDRRPME